MTAGDFVEMDVAGAENVFATLSAKGTALDAFWNRARRTVTAGEVGIGGDKIAQAFRSVYDPSATGARQKADLLPTAFADLATSGRTAASLYQETDREAARRFRGPR